MKLTLCTAFFLVCSLVYAQEMEIAGGKLTFGGKVASGVFFEFDDVPLKDATGAYMTGNRNFGSGDEGKVWLWNETDTKTALRGDLTAAYTKGNAGLRIRLRSDWGWDKTANAIVNNAFERYAYGWLSVFDDALKFTGGYIDLSDNVWGTLGDGDWDIGGGGLRVEFKPFNLPYLNTLGLGDFNIGAFLLVPWGKNPNTLHDKDNVSVSYDAYVTIERTLQETAFGFRWTHPWFYAGAQVQLDSDVDGKDMLDHTNTKVWSGADDEMRLMFGAGFTLLPELTLTAEGDFNGLGNWDARGTGDLRQTLKYTLSLVPVPYLDHVFLGLKAKELLYGYDMRELLGREIDLAPWIQIKPFIGYQVFDGLSVAFETGFGSGFQLYAHPAALTKMVNETSNFYLKPNVVWAMNNGLELRAWYMYTAITYGDLADGSTFADRKMSQLPKQEDNQTFVESITRHQIAVEFVWSF